MNKTKRLLSMLLLLTATVMGAWALPQDSDGYYLLSTAQDWQDFAAIVQTTPTAKAKMTADIDLGNNQTMIGTAEHPFQGEFNGQRHTLTLNLNTSTDYTAPFAYVGNGADIRRLIIDGTISSTASSLSGVIGRAEGSVSLTIVQVAATVKSGTGTSGDQYLGGLIGTMASATVTLNDCFFTGVQNSTRCTSAICGNGSGSVVMNNTLLMGTYSGQNMHPICHDGLTVSGSNNYLCMSYTSGSVPPCVTEVTREQIATGEIAMKLQEGREDEQIWGQDLVNGSSTPIITEDSSLRVYGNGEGMYGNLASLPTSNAYAIWCADNQTLYFDYRAKGLSVGDTYQGHTVTALWSGTDVVYSPSNSEVTWQPSSAPSWQPVCAPTCTEVVFTDSFSQMYPISLYGWFCNFAQLTTLTGLENLHTQRVTNMSNMFCGCSALTELNLSTFDISTLVNTRSMFNSCSNLETIYCNNDWYIQLTKGGDYSLGMFTNCTKLVGKEVFDSSHTHGFYASPMHYFTPTDYHEPCAIWFEDNTTLYFDYVTRPYGTNHTYNGHTVTNAWNGTEVTAMTVEKSPAYSSTVKSSCTEVVIASAFKDAVITNYANWLGGFSKLETITGIENLNTSAATCMKLMFGDCESLTTIDVSHFDTQNVTDMSEMFGFCESLTTIDVSHFDTQNVTDMSNMFLRCKALTTIDVSNWNTQNVTNMGSMFAGCNALTTIDVSNWNTQNVTNMRSMFVGCRALTTIDVSNFDMSKVTDVTCIFQGCKALTTIYCDKDWKTEATNLNLGNNLFIDCMSLVGAINYDIYSCDIDYANPTTGYFTPKTMSYTIPDSGIGTFSSHVAVSLPEGLKAYSCKTYDVEAETISMERIKGTVPANTGVLLKGEAGQTFTITSSTETPEEVAGNALVAVTKATHVEPTDGDKTNFMLSNGKFIKIAASSSDVQMPANKAYLQIATASLPSDGSAKEFRMVWSDEEESGTTGIENEKFNTNPEGFSGAKYNLQGQRVSNDFKGIVIVNGKKVIRK